MDQESSIRKRRVKAANRSGTRTRRRSNSVQPSIYVKLIEWTIGRKALASLSQVSHYLSERVPAWLSSPNHGSGDAISANTRKVLVLDLDETLIQSTPRGSKHFQFMLEVMVDRRACLYYTYKRPYLNEFLRKTASWYDLVLYTASIKEYASPVIDFLEDSCGTANIDAFLFNYEPQFSEYVTVCATIPRVNLPFAGWLRYRYMTSLLHPQSDAFSCIIERRVTGVVLLMMEWVPTPSAILFYLFTIVPFLFLVVSLVCSVVKTVKQQHNVSASLKRSSSVPTPSSSSLLLSRRFYRDSCTRQGNSFVKNLKVVGEDLSKVALVDNSPNSYTLNPDNGIPVSGWINDPADEGLLDLLPFLDALKQVDDVRSILSLRA